ncbi:hypothetical protein NPIL_628411 [Nephila pilipes]|uniref:Transposase Tc1-like domain-containing protein n=1 Tax=Nephila pilipes TaxID=299642 RepID=A0A8X6QT06_NEPPI|nr:hypothetical protein NPIL_628411 [Nephila pilipes]
MDRRISKVLRNHAKGCKKVITLLEDAYVFLIAKGERHLTLDHIGSELVIAIDTQVSAGTVSRRLIQAGLCARKTVKYISIQVRYRRDRLYPGKEHIHWNNQQ